MSNLYVNTDKMNEHTEDKFRYKVARIAATGLIVATMVPFMAGCGKTDTTTYVDTNSDNAITSEYFSDENVHGESLIIGPEITTEGLQDLREFGEDITTVYISYGLNIDDLSALAEYCPNIEELHIYYAPSVSDLSFIYSLHNLKYLDIEENGYVTPELVDYLNRNGIDHNITDQDLENAEEIDRIISEIITDDMTDEEKIQAITYYVIDNYRYRITKAGESNEYPLSSMFENDGGVCASYAYLTDILLRKAGIESYMVTSDSLLAGHAWNLIELDGKYYYLDTTNISQIPFISKFVLDHFNVGFYYMTDPAATSFSAMKDYDDAERISIPPQMIEDIERGESEKNLYEKYGNSVPARVIEIIVAVAGISLGVNLASKGIGAVSNTVSSRKIKKARKRGNKNRRITNSRKRRKNSRQRFNI